MHAIDINALDPKQVYIYYDMYQMMKGKLDGKIDKTPKEIENLDFLNMQLEHIESWANRKMNESLHWTRDCL